MEMKDNSLGSVGVTGPQTRPETGTMQFGDDWRGIFLRGDTAVPLAMTLKMYLDHPENQEFFLPQIQGLIRLLLTANQHTPDPDCQIMKPFTECLGTKENA